MIYFVTGKIGGGKTLLMLTHALEHLGKGGCVVSNIALVEERVDDYMRRRFRRRLVEGQIQFHDFEAEPRFHREIPFGVPELPVMVICDEAQLVYNAADAQGLQRNLSSLVSFLTQSRKACVDVWFVTQHDTTVWAQFRHQALFGYKCRDMRQITLPFVGRLPSLGLSWVKYDIMSGEIMERGKTPLSKDLFGLYDTRQMYDSQMRELQANARVWLPVPRNAIGKYETFVNRPRVHWWARLLGLQGIHLVGREADLRSDDDDDDGNGGLSGVDTGGDDTGPDSSSDCGAGPSESASA